MRKLYLTLLVIFMVVAIANAQQPNNISLKGNVNNKKTGAPVAGQTIFVAMDSVYSAYYKKVVTDDSGFYSIQIPFMSATTQGSIIVYTYDCNGVEIRKTGYFTSGNLEIIIDFNICTNQSPGCTASFKYTEPSNNKLTFAFFDGSYSLPGSTVINHKWDFGDSTSSTEQNPVHTFVKPGLYNVCHTISDSNCSNSYCLLIEAGITSLSPCENYFLFTNDSSQKEYVFSGFLMNVPATANTWTWDFGDGTTATGQTVSHSFASTTAKNYVCLTTTGIDPNGTSCTSTSCQEVYIYVPSPCESSFWYQADSSGKGYTFQGYAQNSQVNTWDWSFGDGTTATGQIVSHSFTGQNDTYSVCLKTSGVNADGSICSYSYCQDIFYSFPSACENYFWYQADSSGQGYTFQGWTKNNRVNSWTWDFGDGTTATGQIVSHSFTNANANYSVCLTTIADGTDSSSCTYSSCQDVYTYIPSLCESTFWYQADSSGYRYTFEGYAKDVQIYSWAWDFGDGTIATGQKVSHSFNFNPNSTVVHYVCLTTTGIRANGDSCTFNSCQEVYINPPSPCENYFKVYSESGSVYSFSGDVNSGTPADYYWDFGDGTSDTGQMVKHAYGKIYTTFNVCLTTVVHVPGSTGFYQCKSISCQTIYNGVDSSSCKAIISVIPDSARYTYRFLNLTQSNYSYFNWNFGDGSQSTEANPVHTYSSPGMYMACLSIADSINNCKNQSCQEIWVNMIQPGCQASFTVIQADSSNSTTSGFMFFNTSAPEYTNQQWSFGDGTWSSDFNPLHTYAAPGIYNACLTVWDSMGTCKSNFCMDIVAGKVIGDNTVSGIVFAGNTLADKGNVWLISPDNSYYAETLIDSAGMYSFKGVPSGSYYIYAMLTPGSSEFFAYMPTYYASSMSWQGATIIHTGEPNAWYPISLVPSMYWSQGEATITGTINWISSNKTQGNPAANIEVVLFNSYGSPIAYTFTNNDGTFVFNNLPYGEYTLQAEMTGKATEAVAITLSENSATANFNFVVDETAINMVGILEPDKTQLLAGNPYPNPVGAILNLKLNASASGTAMVDILDLQGRIVNRESISLSGGTNRISINTGNLAKGSYLLRVNSEGYKPIQRRFIK